MSHLPATLALTLALILSSQGVRGSDRPLVQERYDALAFVRFEDRDSTHVVFIRDGQIMATRLLDDGMILALDGPDFVLSWRDYWNANRAVRARLVVSLVLEPEPPEDVAHVDNAWLDMRRNMRDLEAPPPEGR